MKKMLFTFVLATIAAGTCSARSSWPTSSDVCVTCPQVSKYPASKFPTTSWPVNVEPVDSWPTL